MGSMVRLYAELPQSEDGAARGAFDLIDWLARHLVAESVDFWNIFEFLSLCSWAVVEELESSLIEIAGIEAPEDVLEVECAASLIDQHHSRQMVVSVEVLERILRAHRKSC